MIIDNFDLMQSILKPESTDDFWFGQIIARRKDCLLYTSDAADD